MRNIDFGVFVSDLRDLDLVPWIAGYVVVFDVFVFHLIGICFFGSLSKMFVFLRNSSDSNTRGSVT